MKLFALSAFLIIGAVVFMLSMQKDYNAKVIKLEREIQVLREDSIDKANRPPEVKIKMPDVPVVKQSENKKSFLVPLFNIGDEVEITDDMFERIGISSETGVTTYKYKQYLPGKFFGRSVSDIVIGVKRHLIVTIIYNIIPDVNDNDVPIDIVTEVESYIKQPLDYYNEVHTTCIGDTINVSLCRRTNALTFYKDRILLLISVKHSLLKD